MTHCGLKMEAVSLRVAQDPNAPPILDTVSAEFPSGETSLVTGPVGAGKSTLIHLLAGLIRPTEGIIRADDDPVSKFTAPHLDRWRRSVGVVFQHLELLDTRTVHENVMLPLLPVSGRHASKVKAADRALTALALSHLASSPVSTLSGGERQRTALARALVNGPKFLLLDEPTSHLDDAGVELVLSRIEACTADGTTVLVVSHDPRLSRRHIFRVHHHLDAGRLSSVPW